MDQTSRFVTGEVVDISPIDERSGYKVRYMVLQIPGGNPNYPERILLEYGGKDGKAVERLDKVSVGDVVEAFYNLSARQYNGRWYGSNRGWKLTVAHKASQASQSAQNCPASTFEEIDRADETLPF